PSSRIFFVLAQVAESVDAPHSKCGIERCVGSSPTLGTNTNRWPQLSNCGQRFFHVSRRPARPPRRHPAEHGKGPARTTINVAQTGPAGRRPPGYSDLGTETFSGSHGPTVSRAGIGLPLTSWPASARSPTLCTRSELVDPACPGGE